MKQPIIINGRGIYLMVAHSPEGAGVEVLWKGTLDEVMSWVKPQG